MTERKFNELIPLLEDMLYMYFLHTTQIGNVLSENKRVTWELAKFRSSIFYISLTLVCMKKETFIFSAKIKVAVVSLK